MVFVDGEWKLVENAVNNGDGTVKTIEGNTSGEGGGSCVAIHDRDRSIIYGYATPVKK